MPYGGKTKLLNSPGVSHALSPIMSFADSRHVKTARVHDGWRRLSHDNGIGVSNQKNVLKNLNDRLAAYLKKVCMLEESNGKLEKQIKELIEKRKAVVQDNSRYEKTIAELESQIKEAKIANTEVCLNIDNVKLTADIFKAKYESERSLHQAIVADIKELKTVKNDLESQNSRLETELQILTEELNSLRKDHEEDIGRHQAQPRREVNVEVDSKETTDLIKALEEMRAQYCTLADQHLRDTNAWFVCKSKEPVHQGSICMESLQNHKREAAVLRRTVQELELELEVLHNMKYAQEVALLERDMGYTTQLQDIQQRVCRREEELGKIRAQAAQMASDSRILMYLKHLLEMEIRTYAMLMDEEEIKLEELHSDSIYGDPKALKSRQKSLSVITKFPPLFEDLKMENEKYIGL
ncbi:keratin, type I cytoskeletal 12-like isoform 2-T2 [Discoglossus pictus]